MTEQPEERITKIVNARAKGVLEMLHESEDLVKKLRSKLPIESMKESAT